MCWKIIGNCYLLVNFSQNSTKTIRLFALDFYEAMVDLASSTIKKSVKPWSQGWLTAAGAYIPDSVA